MASLIAPVLTAGVLTATTLGLAGAAGAAPAGSTDATQTVNQLQDRGFHVIVNKVGSAPLDQCAVNAVRPGHTVTRMDSGSGAPGAADDIVTTVTVRTVYLDLRC